MEDRSVETKCLLRLVDHGIFIGIRNAQLRQTPSVAVAVGLNFSDSGEVIESGSLRTDAVVFGQHGRNYLTTRKITQVANVMVRQCGVGVAVAFDFTKLGHVVLRRLHRGDLFPPIRPHQVLKVGCQCFQTLQLRIVDRADLLRLRSGPHCLLQRFVHKVELTG